jgi:hypothetical protein
MLVGIESPKSYNRYGSVTPTGKQQLVEVTLRYLLRFVPGSSPNYGLSQVIVTSPLTYAVYKLGH